MSPRDIVREIIEIKERSPRGLGEFSHDLESLRNKWQRADRGDGAIPDFFIIRAVTILEVSARRNLALLIDHKEEFAERAVELSKNFKMDFATARSVQGRAVTLGDIVAQSVPVNSFGQILQHFEALLGKPLRPLLTAAVDRWRTEVLRLPPEPLIVDFDNLVGRLSRLFKIRHILCHELPESPVYSVNEVDEILEEASRFSQALGEVLNFEKFGRMPLTQTEMNIAAGDELRNKEAELDELLAVARAYVGKFSQVPALLNPSGETWLSCFEDAQERWLNYRNAQCNFVTSLNEGGTIRGLLWARVATMMTELRIKELNSFLEFEANH